MGAIQGAVNSIIGTVAQATSAAASLKEQKQQTVNTGKTADNTKLAAENAAKTAQAQLAVSAAKAADKVDAAKKSGAINEGGETGFKQGQAQAFAQAMHGPKTLFGGAKGMTYNNISTSQNIIKDSVSDDGEFIFDSYSDDKANKAFKQSTKNIKAKSNQQLRWESVLNTIKDAQRRLG